MAADYEIWLTQARGMRLQPLHDVTWFQASRTVNRIGYFAGRWPWTLDDKILRPDRQIQIWRQPPGGIMSLWRPYFIQGWRFETGPRGEEYVYITGVDPNDLLRRRIVAHYAGETNAVATAEEADDLMKRIVTDAITDGTNPAPSSGTRAWSDFSVAGDLTDGPQLTKDFAWQPLLTHSGSGILPSLAEAAKEAGTEVWFDVAVKNVSPTAITFQFRTYTGQPGQDMTSKMKFDKERTLKKPYLEYDYRNEITYVYAGGQGLDDEREIQQVYRDRSGYYWGRCEAFADARDQDTANGTREAGRALLKEGRPAKRFGAEIMETPFSRMGLHWNFGDKVRARYRDEEFDSIITSVVLNVANGVETISARLEYIE